MFWRTANFFLQNIYVFSKTIQRSNTVITYKHLFITMQDINAPVENNKNNTTLANWQSIPAKKKCTCVPSGICHSHTLLGCPHPHYFDDKGGWRCGVRSDANAVSQGERINGGTGMGSVVSLGGSPLLSETYACCMGRYRWWNKFSKHSIGFRV